MSAHTVEGGTFMSVASALTDDDADTVAHAALRGCGRGHGRGRLVLGADDDADDSAGAGAAADRDNRN